MRKICVVTGTRADYGLLYWLMKDIQQDLEFELQIIVTGMHLSPEFGLTYKVIEQDGFQIQSKLEMLLSGDTPAAIAKSIGLAVIGFADTLAALKPDLLVVLGDRIEIFAAAQAALVAKIPIAHIAGGDITEGAIDEAIRHGITKMSHLHFVTNDSSAKIVRQLGENSKFIFNVGSPGIDYLKRIRLLTREQLEARLGLTFLDKNVLITFHPATLDLQPAAEQFAELIQALDRLGDRIGFIFTKPNADPGGRAIILMIDDYVVRNPNARCFTSLGQLLYLSTIANVDAVVGNSSSGLYEAPSFKIPTVNIGDRQRGRLLASSVIQCAPKAGEIEVAIRQAFAMDCSAAVNPYGDGNSSLQILSILKSISDYQSLLKKKFCKVELSDDGM